MAVFPSADTATELPWYGWNAAPVPAGLAPGWLHTPPLPVYTHAEPTKSVSSGPTTMAVAPSADTATETPWSAPFKPAAPVPTSLGPCWLHIPPLRAYTDAAPARMSAPPPTMTVFPSADTATERPRS